MVEYRFSSGEDTGIFRVNKPGRNSPWNEGLFWV
jgi:hypothetical protein